MKELKRLLVQFSPLRAAGAFHTNQTCMQQNNCTHHHQPEDSWVLRAKAHQILECRIMKRPGWQGSRAKGIFVQEKGNEEGQQDCHQLRTWRAKYTKHGNKLQMGENVSSVKYLSKSWMDLYLCSRKQEQLKSLTFKQNNWMSSLIRDSCETDKSEHELDSQLAFVSFIFRTGTVIFLKVSCSLKQIANEIDLEFIYVCITF